MTTDGLSGRALCGLVIVFLILYTLGVLGLVYSR